MIDRVIVWGLHRGGIPVPQEEISQMIGRCGRSYEKSGHATLLIENGEQALAQRYLSSGPGPVLSRMDIVENVAFALMPRLQCAGSIDESMFNEWYSRSLAHRQGRVCTWIDVMKHLLEYGCVREKDGIVYPTALGRLSCQLYFAPFRAAEMKHRMEALDSRGLQYDCVALSWALSGQVHPEGEVDDEAYLEFTSRLSGTVSESVSAERPGCYAVYCVLSRMKSAVFKNEIAQARKDMGRTLSLAEGIADAYISGVANALKCARGCLNAGMPFSHYVLFQQLPGVSRAIISELESLSLHSMADIVRGQHRIEMYGSPELRRYYNEQLLKILSGETQNVCPAVPDKTTADDDAGNTC